MQRSRVKDNASEDRAFLLLCIFSNLFLGIFYFLVAFKLLCLLLVKRTSTWERLVLVFASCRLDDFVAILPSLQSCLCAISFPLRCCPICSLVQYYFLCTIVPCAVLPVLKVVLCAILPWVFNRDPWAMILCVQYCFLFNASLCYLKCTLHAILRRAINIDSKPLLQRYIAAICVCNISCKMIENMLLLSHSTRCCIQRNCASNAAKAIRLNQRVEKLQACLFDQQRCVWCRWGLHR